MIDKDPNPVFYKHISLNFILLVPTMRVSWEGVVVIRKHMGGWMEHWDTNLVEMVLLAELHTLGPPAVALV